MISVKYENGEIKVTVDDLQSIYPKEELPLKLEICKAVSQKVIWSCELNSSSWASFPNSEMNDVIIKNQTGTIIYRYNWDPMRNGSFHYKALLLYCHKLMRQGIRPRGIAIGTHDGEFGEWVPLALSHKSDIMLVDGSEKQFNDLVENYKGHEGLLFLNAIITPQVGEVEFFEGGKGYTNSVVERVIRSWETEDIHSTKKPSISINDLIKSVYNEKFDWLHLDVEGLDAKLIMSINKDYLPNLIVFEENNLFQIEKNDVYSWLKNKNYSLYPESGICTALKIY